MTLFEKIIARQIPATIVYEDEWTIAFKDIAPMAPTHLLVVPKKVIVNVSEAGDDDTELLGRCLQTVRRVAADAGLEHYRVVTNNGEAAGQSVFHLHFHVLGGRGFGWPPG